MIKALEYQQFLVIQSEGPDGTIYNTVIDPKSLKAIFQEKLPIPEQRDTEAKE